jgi:tetratricopeptide (TPR) repeat protein/SAM-dependent methyltransferase
MRDAAWATQSIPRTEALAQAIAHHRAGRLPEAERLYRAILDAQPLHPDANYNIGLLAVQVGRPEGALPHLKAALEGQPSQGQFWLSYIDALIQAGHPDTALQVLAQGRQRGLAGAAIEALSARASAAAQRGGPFAVAVAHHMAGRLEEAVASYRHALATSPDAVEAHSNLAIALYGLGRLEEAVASYRRAVDIKPDHAEAHNNLGSTLRALGRLAEAEASCRSALAITPDFAEAHYNLGTVLADLGRLNEAEASYRRALEVRPDIPEAHNNLGNALRDQGRLEEAAASYRRALALQPNVAELHGNLGNTLRDLCRWEEAETSCRRALALKPDYAEAYNILGNILRDLGRQEEAVANYRRALEIKPDIPGLHTNLGSAYRDLGRLAEALSSCMTALRIKETPEAKSLFVSCVKRPHFTQDDYDVRAALARALTEPWDRPTDLMPTGAILVKLNPLIGECVVRSTKAWPQRLSARELFATSGIAAVSAGMLLRAILVSAPICDIDLERFLTMARHALLAVATGAEANEDGQASLLDFHCALARQCFINEYVFDWTAPEAAQARALKDSLVAALEAEAPVSVLWLLAVASYFPLHSLPLARRLLDRPWPETVAVVLTQQIRDPEEEMECRSTINQLTTINDEISKLVRQQYEENPYPRWIKAAPVDQPVNFDTILCRTFPLAPFRPLGKATDLDVLIAGCGTGQQAIDAAQLYKGARFLAVDLSLASLGYAKRKSAALGLDMIEYAQADIMQLGSLDRRFDVIEASGVLHHLADPLAGWRVLLGLLRPGGFMRLGLYSEVARRDVVRGRAFIAERKYGATEEEIRRCRQELMAAGGGADLYSFLYWSDFFSISACRDLLFHVQEHRMTLDGIADFLDESGLQLLGFEIDSQVLQAYKLRYPNDCEATNLRQWQMFENDNPDTFRGMYQFWVQKPVGRRPS